MIYNFKTMGLIRRGFSYVRENQLKIYQWAVKLVALFFILTITTVILLRWIPVVITPLMVIRSMEQMWNGKEVRMEKTWVPIEEISFNLQRSVISSEDPKFLDHRGFDFDAIAKAIEANKTRKVKIGASTISQQTAKNVFLYPTRSYIRKGLEAYFTMLIEFIWGKNRILEVYLNVIELGPGIYGAEAASHYYFKMKAKDLSLYQASSLAAVLPNPRRWNPVQPTNYIQRKQNFVRTNLHNFEPGYFEPLKEAQKPKVDEEKSKQKKKKKNKNKPS